MKKIIIILCIFSEFSFSECSIKGCWIIGLASHDMFAWDRKNEVNTENGRLDKAQSSITKMEAGGSRRILKMENYGLVNH